ncbi:NAD-dependent epimerase/dehydratase family protein [Asticcacaulis sp.]|uniref:NAD-dependent epimerase/dehydratase family protein n=1 Tax=Asticcacaulis sp. TaxID=1872648 RepID=UPI00391BB0C9
MTGATGFLGRHAAWELVRAGHEVHNLTRPESDRSALDARPEGPYVKAVTLAPEMSNLCEVVSEIKPDVCLHIAAIARVKDNEAGIREMVATNILMPSLIARALMDVGAGALVTCGTSWQTAGSDGSYVPFDYYSATKQAAEDAITGYVVQGLPAIALRMFDNYGEDDTRNKIVDLLFDSASKQKPLAMSPGEQLIDLVYVDDAARALRIAVERAARLPGATMEVYGVSSGDQRKLKDVAALIGRIVGQTAPIEWGGRPYRDREVMVPYSGLASVPGWEVTVRLEEGLERVWQQKRGD